MERETARGVGSVLTLVTGSADKPTGRYSSWDEDEFSRVATALGLTDAQLEKSFTAQGHASDKLKKLELKIVIVRKKKTKVSPGKSPYFFNLKSAVAV